MMSELEEKTKIQVDRKKQTKSGEKEEEEEEEGKLAKDVLFVCLKDVNESTCNQLLERIFTA